MYQYGYPDLMRVPTINELAYKVDTEHRMAFTHTLRRYADQNDDRMRVERGKYLNYYTNDIASIEKLINYVLRLKRREDDLADTMLDLNSIRYFPGTVLERNIRYRKKRLPYGKYHFQILGNRMDHDQFMDWEHWAKQYPEHIRINENSATRKWGTWCGESIGYITDEKMLQLVQFKLGSHINKIIEFQLRETD